MNIAIIGLGYVGLPLALCANTDKYNITAIDVSFDKIQNLKVGILPIKDSVLEQKIKGSRVKFTKSLEEGLKDADIAFVCVPTDWDEKKKTLNTEIVEGVIADGIKINNSVTFVIKSTISYKCTKKLCSKLNYDNILFSPEFLREGHAGEDTMNPSRIIVGSDLADDTCARAVINYLLDLIESDEKRKQCQTLIMSTQEAESVKLFANTYLATRVAFFNELSTFALKEELDVENIIKGICLDWRIGDYYNQPSFGFGGYCLPKDSLQCSELFFSDESAIIKNIAKANDLRKDFIVGYVISKGYNIIGIDRLVMKPGSDNFRESASVDIVTRLANTGKKVIIFEPMLNMNPWKDWNNVTLINDYELFNQCCEVVLSDAKIKRLKENRNEI